MNKIKFRFLKDHFLSRQIGIAMFVILWVFLPTTVSGQENPQQDSAGTAVETQLIATGTAGMDPAYTYDLNSNRTSMIDPTGTTYYEYDALNRLTKVTNPSGHVVTFEYDAIGRRTRVTLPNGVETNYTYDAASRLLNIEHKRGIETIAFFSYDYDKVGNRTRMTNIHGVHDYTYDNTYQLIGATHPQPYNPDEAFTYDPVGNRLTSADAPGFNNDHDDANRLVENAENTYEYDGEGNMVKKVVKATGAETVFTYNAENTLTRIDFPDSTFSSYRYDGNGRRFEKNVSGVITRYIYDQEDILLELDGDDNIVARYTHGPGIDEPLIMERDTDGDGSLETAYYYHVDGLGSVVALTDYTGDVVQSYEYDSYGSIIFKDGESKNKYSYTARELDAESRLYFYRDRYYEPRIGQFLQQDALGFPCGLFRSKQEVGHIDEVNPYRYAIGNPVNKTDPMGMGVFIICWRGTSIINWTRSILDICIERVERETEKNEEICWRTKIKSSPCKLQKIMSRKRSDGKWNCYYRCIDNRLYMLAGQPSCKEVIRGGDVNQVGFP